MEHTRKLFSAVGSWLKGQNWDGIVANLDLAHGLFAFAMILIVVGLVTGLVVVWFVSLKRRPILTLIGTFVLLSIILWGVESYGNHQAASAARINYQRRAVLPRANVNERGDSDWGTYAQKEKAPARPDVILGGDEGWVPVLSNETNTEAQVTIQAGGRITFWPAPYGQASLECGPNGLRSDPEGMPGTSQTDRGQAGRYPAPNLPRCALIAMINGHTSFIGTEGTVVVPAGSTLYVTSNDNAKSDNRGTWSLKVLS